MIFSDLCCGTSITLRSAHPFFPKSLRSQDKSRSQEPHPPRCQRCPRRGSSDRFPVSAVCTSELLLLVLNVWLNRLSGGWCRRPKKPLLPPSLHAKLFPQSPILLFQLINATLLMQTDGAVVRSHGTVPCQILTARPISHSRTQREKKLLSRIKNQTSRAYVNAYWSPVFVVDFQHDLSKV